MGIINRDINVFNSVCDIVCLYNINIRLDFLIYASCSIGNLEAKLFKDELEPLDHFVG